MLVPADVPGSSSMLQRLGSGRGRLAGPVRGLLERSVRTRAFALARWPMLRVPGADPAADSIETHLAECFGAPVRVGVMLGTRRVNQKPVLQVFDLDGRLLGYAKVGHNDLTAALVRREADALTRSATSTPPPSGSPRMLHHGRWSDLEVLVISALPVDARHPVLPAARLAAMREVVRLAGTTRSTLATSSFWDRTDSSADELAREPLGDRAAGRRRRHRAPHGAEVVSWAGGTATGATGTWAWATASCRCGTGSATTRPSRSASTPSTSSPRPCGRASGSYRRQEETFLRAVPGTLTQVGVDPAVHDADPAALPARDLRALRGGADARRHPRAATTYCLGPRAAGAHPGRSTPHLREDDHEHPHRRPPPRQDRWAASSRSGWARPPPGCAGSRRSSSSGRSAPGTTSFFRALQSHPLIHSANYHKGVNYFDVNYDQGPRLVPGPLPHRVVPAAAHPRRGGRPDHVRGQRLLHVPPPGRRADGPATCRTSAS